LFIDYAWASLSRPAGKKVVANALGSLAKKLPDFVERNFIPFCLPNERKKIPFYEIGKSAILNSMCFTLNSSCFQYDEPETKKGVID
jgi:hypothetical protein